MASLKRARAAFENGAPLGALLSTLRAAAEADSEIPAAPAWLLSQLDSVYPESGAGAGLVLELQVLARCAQISLRRLMTLSRLSPPISSSAASLTPPLSALATG